MTAEEIVEAIKELKTVATLQKMGLGKDGIEWVKSLGDVPARSVWRACVNPEWLGCFLESLHKRGRLSPKYLVSAAVACAESVEHLSRNDGGRVRRANEAVRGWLRGKVTEEELEAAKIGAYVAAASQDRERVHAATTAATAAASAKNDVLYVHDAIAAAAKVKEAKELCDVIRAEVAWEIVQEAFNKEQADER
jgi:hypothetical protein